MQRLVYLLKMVLVIGCGSDDFSSRSKLGDLRLLALVTDKPEVNSTGTVVITPVISYVNGGNVTLKYSWEACPDPGINFGADISCESVLASLKQSGTGNSDTSSLAGSFYTGAMAPISVDISASVISYMSLLSSEIQFNGLDYLFILTITDESKNFSRKSFRTIKVTNKTSLLNSNPTMGNILYRGSSLTSFPSEQASMQVNSLSAPETYQLQTSSGTQSLEEDAYLSWYSSTGEFRFDRTDPDEENTFNPNGGTEGVIVAVYRDGRGGVAYQVVSF